MTLPAEYFDAMYDAAPDPWGLETRWYEQRKYAVTIASLPRPSYRRGFEIGCSIGVLTAMLAQRCDALLAVDVNAAAVDGARARLRGARHVDVRRLAVPSQWPPGSFDLVVLSEVGYYLSTPDLDDLLGRVTGSLDDAGSFVAVHWRHPVADYPLTGDEVHARIAAATGLDRQARHEEADFVLEVFAPPPAISVAAATGLIT